MSKTIKNILKVIGFLSIGVGLFWLVYRNQDISTIVGAIKKAKYEWLLLSVSLGLLSHISRALRWDILIRPLGYKARKKTLFYSVMIMYLTNNAIPRSGEVARCGVVSRYEKVPFTSLLGTVITERVIDMIMLIILTIIAALTQFNVFADFIENNESAQETINKVTGSVGLIIGAAVLALLFVVLIFVFRKKIKKTKLYQKFQKFIEDFISGIKTILHLERKWEFIAHSVFIWLMYFLMIYVVFKAFDFTSHLTLIAALAIFVLSNYGMVFPSPGGIGSWHFMAIESLFIYGIDRVNGSAFAFAAHESQILMLIVVGLISLIAISFVKVKDSQIIKENTNN